MACGSRRRARRGSAHAQRPRGRGGPGGRRRPTRRSSCRSTWTAATTGSTRSSRSPTRATAQLRARIGIAPATTLAGRRPPRVRLAPVAHRAEDALRRGQGRRAALGGLRRTPTSRTSTRQIFWRTGRRRAHRSTAPGGWAARSTRSAGPTTRSRGSASGLEPRPDPALAPRPGRHRLRPGQLRLLHRGRAGATRRSCAAVPRRRRRRTASRARRRPAHVSRRVQRAATSSRRCGWTTSTRSRRRRWPYPDSTSATGCRTSRGCSAPASARASRRSATAGFDTHDDQPDRPRRAAERPSATRCSRGRPTSTPAGCPTAS